MPTSFTASSEDLSSFFGEVLPHLDERQRMIITGVTARTLGHDGVKAVAVASGLSLSTVQHGARAVDAVSDPATVTATSSLLHDVHGESTATVTKIYEELFIYSQLILDC